MIDVLKTIVGDFFGGLLVVCLCAGLLLSMNTATMDGSRALSGWRERASPSSSCPC